VPNVQRPRSLVICGELLRGFAIDQRAPLTDNNIVDFMHAFMSVNCCDLCCSTPRGRIAWKRCGGALRQMIPQWKSRGVTREEPRLERFLNDLEVFRRLRSHSQAQNKPYAKSRMRPAGSMLASRDLSRFGIFPGRVVTRAGDAPANAHPRFARIRAPNVRVPEHQLDQIIVATQIPNA